MTASDPTDAAVVAALSRRPNTTPDNILRGQALARVDHARSAGNSEGVREALRYARSVGLTWSDL